MNTFSALTVDKLEVCYRCSLAFFDTLEAFQEIETEGFKLEPMTNSSNTVIYTLIYRGNLIWEHCFGTVTIRLAQEYPNDDYRYLWITVANKALYSCDDQAYIREILRQCEATFNLSVNNITKYELAMDAEANLGSIINNGYTNPDVTPIVVGKAYEDGVFIPSVTREIWGSKTSPMLVHWRIKGSETKFQMYCYDKKQEIEHSGKNYIKEYYNRQHFTHFWRLEIRVWKENMQQFIAYKNISYETLLDDYMFIDEGKQQIMEYFSGRLMRFRFNRNYIPSVYEYICSRLD